MELMQVLQFFLTLDGMRRLGVKGWVALALIVLSLFFTLLSNAPKVNAASVWQYPPLIVRPGEVC